VISSTKTFHSPQLSHRPAHFEWTEPQDWQTKQEEGLGIAGSDLSVVKRIKVHMSINVYDLFS
jgi:hypothetical protein